jgi:hypothetical protein
VNGGRSKTGQTLCRLREQLLLATALTPDAITPAARFEALIPDDERRRVWDGLRAGGLALPALELSPRVFLLAALMVLAPVLLLAFAQKNAAILLSVTELGLLARRITRPLAVHPPRGCETVREAVLRLTPFDTRDYKAGLWPPEDIADRVRLLIAEVANLPFESVKRESRLIEDLGLK